MSLKESNYFPDLFLSENQNCFFNFSTISDNLNEIFSESSHSKKKNIRFISTKEELPSINFLKKKTSLKEDDKDKENSNAGRWNKEEQKKFAEAVLNYGNNWKQIQNHVFSRNMTQVRSHAQKFLMKLKETNFMIKQNIDLNLSWTKTMNFLRKNIQYNELKELLFSVEQNEEKKIERKKQKKIAENKKAKKKQKLIDSFDGNSNNETYGGSFRYIFDSNKIYEKDLENIKKEEKEENESLEKFIECFNITSEDINLNSSFEEISYKNPEDINETPNNYKI